MKAFLYLSIFTAAVLAAVCTVATIAGHVPNSGWLAVAVLLFAMYSSVNCLKEFYED